VANPLDAKLPMVTDRTNETPTLSMASTLAAAAIPASVMPKPSMECILRASAAPASVTLLMVTDHTGAKPPMVTDPADVMTSQQTFICVPGSGGGPL
jgi:hypothetical protein